MQKADDSLGAKLSFAARFSLLSQHQVAAEQRVFQAQQVCDIIADEYRQLAQHAKRTNSKSRRASGAVFQRQKRATDSLRLEKSKLRREKSLLRKITKKENLLRREILERANVPEPYWDQATIWVDRQMTVNIIYGDDGRNHAHVAINDHDVTYYSRGINDPHGSQNYINVEK